MSTPDGGGETGHPPVGSGIAAAHTQGGEPRHRAAARGEVWGGRALLLLPVAIAVAKLVDLRGERVPPVAWALAVAAIATLLVGVVRAWRAVRAPRLSSGQALDVFREIPRERRRVLFRALRRRGPLPPELRADAARYLWASRTQFTTWLLLAVGGANATPMTSLLDDDVFNLVIGLGLAVAVATFTLLDRRLVRRARELDLPLTGRLADNGDRGDRGDRGGPADGSASAGGPWR